MSRSASVDLPLSIWAMIAKFRIFSIAWAVMGRGIAGRALEGNGIRARGSTTLGLLRAVPLSNGRGVGVRVPSSVRASRGHLLPKGEGSGALALKTTKATQENILR